MKEELTELQRLDVAARAEVAEEFYSSAAVVSTFFTLICILQVMNPKIPFSEPLILWVIAGIAVLGTVMIWVRWRYALYVWTLSSGAFLIIEFLVERSKPLAFRGWIIFLGVIALLYRSSRTDLKRAEAFATARARGWEKERSQVQQWLDVLRHDKPTEQVIELATGSFWTGYFTYRLLNSGRCWSIAKFKTGNNDRLLDYKIRDLGAIQITQLPDGKLDIHVDQRKLCSVDVSPDRRARLLQLLAQSQTF
jgi:hypothetical protein